MRTVTIARDDAGQRLDRFLRKALPQEPLSRIFRSIRTGRVRLNGRRASPEARLAEGDAVELRLPEESLAALGRPKSRASRAPDPPLAVLYRDEHVLALDKPPFLLVQRGEGGAEEPTLDAIAARRYGGGGSLTFVPALAHRLDRGTSGVVLLGLSAEGLRGLTDAFRRRKVEKRYLALVAGDPGEDAFTVELPLRRERATGKGGARVGVSHAPDALTARTEFRVLARAPGGGYALVEARPLTGRTHQIRAHLRAAGFPIVGDPTYGVPATNREWRRRTGLRRPFLHAASVALDHPVDSGRRLAVASPLPGDLLAALRFLGVDPPGS